MNLSSWCIQNNRTVLVLLALVVLGGITTFRTISRRENPEFTIRNALIITRFPGASPRRVEELVTDKIEKRIREIAEIEFVTSQSMTGVSIITVKVWDRYMDMAPIWSRLRNKVEDVKRELPEGVQEPTVNDEFGDVFGLVFALTADGFTYREIKDAADDVRNRLLEVENVAKVDVHGVQAERIFVEFSNARLAEFGFSPFLLAQALGLQNIVQSGGSGLLGPERVIIEPTGEFTSVDQLRRTSLRIPGRAEAVYLEDIATVRRGFVDPPNSMARFNGEKCLVLAISMAAGGNISRVGAEVRRRLEEIEGELPVGLDFKEVAYQPRFVDRSIRDFSINLVQAFGFVVIVMLVFAGLMAGLIAGVLIPISMLLCVLLMPYFDVELQQISIAALIISLGIMVDNGVVVSEDFMVRLARREPRKEAAEGVFRELWKPLFAASLTTIAAFLPIAIADSAVGEYCYSLFVVVTITLLASWLVSLTVVPMLCYYLLRPKETVQTFSGLFYRSYRRAVIFGLKRRWLVVVGVVALTCGGLVFFGFVPKLFFPPNEREMFVIDFWQPYGTDIETTVERVSALEEFLLGNDEVRSVSTFVGYGGPRWYLSLNPEQENPNYAFLLVNTETVDGVPGVVDATRKRLRQAFPDTRATVKLLENGPSVGAPIQVRLSGSSTETLYDLRDRIARVLSRPATTTGIRDDWGEWTKKIIVDVNQDQAKYAGFSSQDVAYSLSTQISGMRATEFREGNEVIPIVLRSRKDYREDLGRLESLNVYSYYDAHSAPLLRVARTELVWQPSNIRRRNEKRTITIQADLERGLASDVLPEIREGIDELVAAPDWPSGYTLEYGGENEESSKAQESIFDGLPVAFGIIALILVAQFNSIRRPVIIVLTIPPMIFGIALGLLGTSAPFGFMALLGMISLMGIIVNNAIMLIDRIEIERSRGCTPQDAIVLSSQKRLRPILTTTITTVVGLVPLSLQGGEMWRPMANTIMFGLLFSTLLTLLLCPVLYSFFFRVGFRDYRWDPAVLDREAD